MAALGPTSRPSDDIANGRVARELPVASALPIRQDLAQEPPVASVAVEAWEGRVPSRRAPRHLERLRVDRI